MKRSLRVGHRRIWPYLAVVVFALFALALIFRPPPT
jgi:hypothetical protein